MDEIKILKPNNLRLYGGLQLQNIIMTQALQGEVKGGVDSIEVSVLPFTLFLFRLFLLLLLLYEFLEADLFVKIVLHPV